ncbi:hypothetical protein EUTSA_v10004975mg [Eutrema salsugineum]|uniref:Uncharacterized protein n=2 Tax=Eutrema salsugineum TaxID=72664 RepID=V4KPF6_EUTSA|nr:hypothetical protein EUTSA_v10004975mg [Eutrema salsugineum]
MTSEIATSPAIPPPPEKHSEHQPLPQKPVNSAPISAVPPSSPQATTEVVANSNGVVSDQVIDEIEEPSYFKYLDSKGYAEKYRKYESDFKQMLLAKYFSGRDPNGANLFEERTTIDGETIMSSKWPCTRFYADPDISYPDPVQCLDEEEQEQEEQEEEEEIVDSATAEITPGEISNGGIVLEKKNSC